MTYREQKLDENADFVLQNTISTFIQVTVTEALMLTPDSSHHSGSGARFDEDQKSKRESVGYSS